MEIISRASEERVSEKPEEVSELFAIGNGIA